MRAHLVRLFAAALLSPALAPALTQAQSGAKLVAVAAERPVRPEKNPPGDIPDDQVFVEYRSPQGFSMRVPEGWARREAGDAVIFTDKYNIIEIAVTASPERPTATSVRENQIQTLERSGKAVHVSHVKAVKLPAGEAVSVAYASNSDPNPVTSKVIRLENERYFVWKDGRLATVTLSAPLGADNADQWKLMAESFRWQ